MGRFVNPDNSAFQKALNSKIYVDKTEFLEQEYTGDILLVAINYDKKKNHQCLIEKYEK